MEEMEDLGLSAILIKDINQLTKIVLNFVEKVFPI